MIRPQTPARPSQAFPALCHGLLAGAVAVMTAWAIAATGAEIIALYLGSSFAPWPAAAAVAAALALAANLALAVRGVRGARPGRPASAAAALIAALVIAAFAAHIAGLARREAGDAPSARTRLWTPVGPVRQFGPFTGGAADASSSMTVWYFDPFEGRDASLLFGESPRPERMARAGEAPGGDGRRREFRLTGLAPATTYYYTAPGFDERVRSFRTAPRRGSGTPVRFLCLGDTGNTRRGGYTISYYPEVMRAAHAWYRSAGGDPDFMIHAGDLVQTGVDLDGWHHHFSSVDTEITALVAPGNHEFLGDFGGNFRYLFGTRGYGSVDYGDIHIIYIHPFDGPGASLDGPVVTTGREQYRFVKEDLARRGGTEWIVAIIHIPLLSTGDYGNSEMLIRQYLDLFREHGVDLVISGHDHNFDLFHADADRGGTLFLVAGTGGSHLDSYIMTRPARRWLDWFHDRASPRGPYQHDTLTASWHRYGELSWGFTDVNVAGDTMTVTYCRWLAMPRFLEITGQGEAGWDMRHLDDTFRDRHGLDRVEVVTRIVKKKNRPGFLRTPEGQEPKARGRD